MAVVFIVLCYTAALVERYVGCVYLDHRACCATSVLVGGSICGLCLSVRVVRRLCWYLVGRYVGCVDLCVLCDVRVGRWDDMWVVLIWITVRVVRRLCW